MPWGVRRDGRALWAMRNDDWLELGFRTDYFLDLLATRLDDSDVPISRRALAKSLRGPTSFRDDFMTTRSQQRRARLRAEYGFDFPDDFYRFWDFVNRLAPLDPLNALNPLGVTLVGPFEVLAGRFDGRVPQHSLLLHWRYHDDPPEFFTVFAGSGDGQHWGYWLDDPDSGAPSCIVSYFASDGLLLDVDGDDLFDASRLQLEYLHADAEAYREHDTENADEYEHQLAELAALRKRLMPFSQRGETGEEYSETYGGYANRDELLVADTMEGAGIVVDANKYRPLSLTDKKLWAKLRKTKDPVALVNEARQALQEGFPGTALKLGQDLWGVDDPRGAYAVELLDAAYAALGRETLRRVLQTHVANRNLPFVDILHEEEEIEDDED